MTDRRGDWMQTFTGRQFWPLDPRPEDLVIEDIAHGLGMICRFGGHTNRFYSVAEHCVVMSRWAERNGGSIVEQQQALLHDAPEAYIGDMVRPLKRQPEMALYVGVDDYLTDMVFTKFIGPDNNGFLSRVHGMDNAILLDERAEFLPNHPAPWYQDTDGTEPLGVVLEGWYPARATWEYLDRFQELFT